MLLWQRLLVVHVVAVLFLSVKVPAAQRTLLITLQTDTLMNMPDQRHLEKLQLIKLIHAWSILL